jgi:peptide/nickel transport system permease protein
LTAYKSPTPSRPERNAELASNRSPLRLAAAQFFRHRLAVVGVVLIALLVLSAVFAPYLTPYEPTKLNLQSKLTPPSWEFPLGTDHFGRDVLTRMLYGARISLLVGLGVVVIAAGIGTPLGVISGFFGGTLDNTIMRMMDALLTFPPLLLAVAIMGTLGADTQNVILAVGLVYIPVFARLARGNTLSLRESTYVSASVALGAPNWRIIVLDILPNIIGVLVVLVTVTFSKAVILEASLSFLGLGVQPPTASWGRDLNEARRYIEDAWWLAAFPTFMIAASVLNMNFIGDGLRDALDPRTNQ